MLNENSPTIMVGSDDNQIAISLKQLKAVSYLR
jgi:hypothetical protein